MTDERKAAGDGEEDTEVVAAAAANELVLGVDRSRCRVRRCEESFLDMVCVQLDLRSAPVCV